MGYIPIKCSLFKCGSQNKCCNCCEKVKQCQNACKNDHTKCDQSTRNNKAIFATIDGETHDLSAWSRIKGISYNTITGRMKLGWTPEEAVTGKRRNQDGV